MPQITRDNHYVPQLYLKQWSKDGTRIWAYHILVPHDNVPMWDLRPIRGVAYLKDLYTSFYNGEETDEFERWIGSEFEAPAKEVIDKVINGKPLTTSDWHKLARFLAAQDVRTLTSYLELTARMEEKLPKIIDNVLKRLPQQLNQHTIKDRAGEDPTNSQQFFKNSFNVEITPAPEEGQSLINVSAVADRSLWLEEQRMLLTKTANALLNHKWSIIQPSIGKEWFTSDHPVVKLNYYGAGEYDFKGGWGNPGTDIFMPLSPHHLLFTQIGVDIPDRLTFSPENTSSFQKFIAEKALRWIFANRKMEEVIRYRPRDVDSEAFKAEEEQLKQWHKIQSESRKTT